MSAGDRDVFTAINAYGLTIPKIRSYTLPPSYAYDRSFERIFLRCILGTFHLKELDTFQEYDILSEQYLECNIMTKAHSLRIDSFKPQKRLNILYNANLNPKQRQEVISIYKRYIPKDNITLLELNCLFRLCIANTNRRFIANSLRNLQELIHQIKGCHNLSSSFLEELHDFEGKIPPHIVKYSIQGIHIPQS